MGGRNVTAASSKETVEVIPSDEGFQSAKKQLENDRKKMWTSVEVHNYYIECGGFILSRHGLVTKLTNEFGDDLVVLSSQGLANILIFRKHAAGILKLCEEENDYSEDVNKVAKNIRKEIKNMSLARDRYAKRINKSSASEYISDSLKALLRQISDDLSEDKLPAILIGNIVTSMASKKPTDLLIDLGILVRDKKTYRTSV